jgi:hypothetical protein
MEYRDSTPGESALHRLLPVLVLAAFVGLCLLGWWLFPVVQGWIAYQDCVALGRTNCGGS